MMTTLLLQKPVTPGQCSVESLETIPGRKHAWSGVAALAALLLVGLLLIYLDAPPAARGSGPNPGWFSADRAFVHVAAIGRAPHPIGSAEHAVVENYILGVLRQNGLTPAVQRATVKDQWSGMPVVLENITAGIKGGVPGQAVLLVAHYDSVSAGPGAADDAAAVAALLEAARIFQSLRPFKRDIYFLFTDGEELGLLGAKAFVAENPLAKNIALVLNFEARGTDGPVILFETSDANAWLIDNASRAASRPVANSLSYEVYKRLPNDTDFTVFKHAGYPGLNFAFIDDVVNYHSANDTPQNLDRGSLQHLGGYAVELGAWFANVDQIMPGKARAIYFDLLGRVLVHYSSATGIFLLASVAALLGWAVFKGFRLHLLRAQRLAAGIALMAASVVTAAVAGLALLWISLRVAARFPHVRSGVLHHSGLYVAAISLTAVALASVLFTWTVARLGRMNASIAGLMVWFGLALAAEVWAPGMTFLWVWPLLFSAMAWVLLVHASRLQNKLLLAAVLLAFLVVVPIVHKIFTAFAVQSAVIVSIFLALLLSLCVVPLRPDAMPRRFTLPLCLSATGLALFLVAFIL
jgi:Peptidase family M28